MWVRVKTVDFRQRVVFAINGDPLPPMRRLPSIQVVRHTRIRIQDRKKKERDHRLYVHERKNPADGEKKKV